MTRRTICVVAAVLSCSAGGENDDTPGGDGDGDGDGDAAQGGTMLTGDCDRTYVHELRQGSSFLQTTTTYAAEFRVTEDVDRVAVTSCGLERFGGDCPGGFSCSGEQPTGECEASATAQLDGDTLRVVCGASFVTTAGGTTTTTGQRWRTVTVVVN